ncbi:MAG: hypothetical protein INR71_12420, partial [Terriglobus roseus]|nr:hypothetical protein [Terriglobus roseus]
MPWGIPISRRGSPPVFTPRRRILSVAQVPIVHVAGTNGKGSICAYLDAVFRRAGLRTGRFNSPHLVEPHDAVLLDGSPSSRALFNATAERVAASGRAFDASPFEQLTATAMSLFAQAQPRLDIAVVEVGMGGATDATNVSPAPLATVLGPVDLDHQALLGDTVEEIAQIKCGIFKKGCPAIVSVQEHPTVREVARNAAHNIGAPATFDQGGRWLDDGSLEVRLDGHAIRARPSLAGSYQAVNASVAATAAHIVRSTTAFAISDEAIVYGLEHTHWPGRLSLVP